MESGMGELSEPQQRAASGSSLDIKQHVLLDLCDPRLVTQATPLGCGLRETELQIAEKKHDSTLSLKDVERQINMWILIALSIYSVQFAGITACEEPQLSCYHTFV